jgi:hypothetical protein
MGSPVGGEKNLLVNLPGGLRRRKKWEKEIFSI